MPIINDVSKIPGLLVEFKDGGLAYRQDTTVIPSTRSVLLLGTAIDGPVMNPVAVDGSTAEAIFGKGIDGSGKPNGATLPEAFNQLYKAGCRDIRMMRVSGKAPTATITAHNTGVTTETLKVQEDMVISDIQALVERPVRDAGVWDNCQLYNVPVGDPVLTMTKKGSLVNG